MISYEKMLCDVNPKYISSHSCLVRPVARETFSVQSRAHLIRPINEIQANVRLYYRYNTYQKFLIDRWEDVCGYLSGKKPSLMIDVVSDYFYKYSNMNHTCPFEGDIIYKCDRISSKDLLIRPLLPAGRFHFDTNFTHGKNREFIGNVQIFFSVSDHRVWH